MGKQKEFRIERVENCCQKLTTILEKQQLTEQKIVDGLETIKIDLHRTTESFENHQIHEDLKDITTNIKTNKKDLLIIDIKVNRFLGGISALLLVMGIMWNVWVYMDNKVATAEQIVAEKQNIILNEKINKLSNLVNRNYGGEQGKK